MEVENEYVVTSNFCTDALQETRVIEFLSDTVDMPLSMQKKEIYDRLSMVLTDYENGEADAETLYKMLVKIQNSWEDVITVQE